MDNFKQKVQADSQNDKQGMGQDTSPSRKEHGAQEQRPQHPGNREVKGDSRDKR